MARDSHTGMSPRRETRRSAEKSTRENPGTGLLPYYHRHTVYIDWPYLCSSGLRSIGRSLHILPIWSNSNPFVGLHNP